MDVEAFGVCPLSCTPNSLIVEASFTNGDAPRDPVAFELITTLVLRLAFNVGELVADVRPDMRGIFVGVSFVNEEFKEDGGGGSFMD